MSKYNQNRSQGPARNSNQGSRTPIQKKSGGGALMGLFAGLVLGVLIAFGVVLYLNKSPLPFQDKFEGASKAAKDKSGVPGSDGVATNASPIELPGKPGDKVKDPKQRFEFYGILEGKQPASPQTAAPTANPAPAAPPTVVPAPAPGAPDAKAPSGDIYYLQAGSFQKAKDADNLKAKLALSGLEVSVQDVNVPEKGTMHRVRVGPYRTLEEMNTARHALSQTGVQATVVKQKE